MEEFPPRLTAKEIMKEVEHFAWVMGLPYNSPERRVQPSAYDEVMISLIMLEELARRNPRFDQSVYDRYDRKL